VLSDIEEAALNQMRMPALNQMRMPSSRKQKCLDRDLAQSKRQYSAHTTSLSSMQ